VGTVLPGANSLGFGFNIYGEPTLTSKTHPLFNMSQIEGEYSLGDKYYDLPQNALPDVVDEPSLFEQRAFESASEFVQDLKASAHVSAAIGAFEGSATAKYERLCQGKKNAVLFALTDLRPHFAIGLKSLNPDYLTDDASAAIDALPDNYTEATKQHYFAFFRKYGMYFIRSVTMGGRLTYYAAVEKRENETTESIMTKVKASYDAYSGKASASWSSVDKQLFASSRISIETRPPGSLESASPQFGDSLTANDGYKEWVRAAKEEPSIVEFQLAPMADLFAFGSAKHDAMLLAREDFGECYIYAEATETAEVAYPGRISVKGVPLVPDNMAALKDYSACYVRQVIVDRKTFEVRLNKAYGVKYGSTGVTEVSGDMLADIKPFDTPDHVLVIASKWNRPVNHQFCISADMKGQNRITPTQQGYFEILRTAGAGPQLQSLLSYKSSGGALSHENTCYVFVGVLGQRANLSREAFAVDQPRRPRSPRISVSFEPVEKNGKPYYAPIL